MDPTRQAVRWSIPGWVFLLCLTFLQVSTHLGWGESPGTLLTSGMFHGVTAAGVALLVTSGIPIGFLLYQIYYWFYGHVFPFNIVPLDRGGAVLRCLPEHLLTPICERLRTSAMFNGYSQETPFLRISPWYTIHRLKPEFRHAEGRKAFRAQQENNKQLVRFLLTKIAADHEMPELKTQATAVADLYHGIGAARVALVAACAAHLAHNLLFIVLSSQRELTPTWRALVCFLLSYTVMAWFFYVLSATRKHSLDTLQAILVHNLSYFLSFSKDRQPKTEGEPARPPVAAAS